MFLAPAPQRHNPFLFPVWLKPAGECESAWKARCPHEGPADLSESGSG